MKEIAELLTLEQGKPLQHAMGELHFCLAILKDAAEKKLPVEVYKDTEDIRVEVRRVPIGVVACICPWNFPLVCSICKWAPAIAFGNTVIVKPSPFTPLSTLLLAEKIKDCLPKGVLNFIAG